MPTAKPPEPARPQTLPGGIILRHAVSPADEEGVHRLLLAVFGSDVVRIARGFSESYPGFDRSCYLLVEDPTAPALLPAPGETGAEPAPATTVVATLCLAPLEWSLGGVRLPVAGMELVATDPRYRGRGLVTALAKRFDELAMADGHLLSGVLGIPRFYSRFGYTFASPMDDGASLPVAETLQAIEADPFRDRGRAFTVRPWERGDLEAVAALADAQEQDLDLRLSRSPALWECWFRHNLWEAMETRQVVTEGGRVVGTFAIAAFGPRRLVYYLAATDRDVLLEIYRYVATVATERGENRVFVRVPADGAASAAAVSVGGSPERNYGWQVKINDRPGLMRAIAPVLEKRLAASPFRTITGKLVFDLYSSWLVLDWRGGRLADAREEPYPEEPSGPRVRMPADAFVKLALGYRTLADLFHESLDVHANKACASLTEVLFPKLKAWVEF